MSSYQTMIVAHNIVVTCMQMATASFMKIDRVDRVDMCGIVVIMA